MTERVWDITITCEVCGRNVAELADEGEPAGPPDWRFDQNSPWGHGAMNGKQAEWYDRPSDPSKIRTRSHTDPSTGDLYLICHACPDANRCRFTTKKWRAMAQMIADAGRSHVAIAELRAIAKELADSGATRRRSRAR